MKLSKKFNMVPEQSPRVFLAIQKYSAPNKLKFTIVGILYKKKEDNEATSLKF